MRTSVPYRRSGLAAVLLVSIVLLQAIAAGPAQAAYSTSQSITFTNGVKKTCTATAYIAINSNGTISGWVNSSCTSTSAHAMNAWIWRDSTQLTSDIRNCSPSLSCYGNVKSVTNTSGSNKYCTKTMVSYDWSMIWVVAPRVCVYA